VTFQTTGHKHDKVDISLREMRIRLAERDGCYTTPDPLNWLLASAPLGACNKQRFAAPLMLTGVSSQVLSRARFAIAMTTLLAALRAARSGAISANPWQKTRFAFISGDGISSMVRRLRTASAQLPLTLNGAK
jgi:hypothetical protein